MGISIIIIWNNTNLEYLNNILFKISQTVIVKHEIIIVCTQDIKIDELNNCKIVFSEKKLLSELYNEGISVCSNEYIWFFNPEKPFLGLVNFNGSKNYDLYQYKVDSKISTMPSKFVDYIKYTDYPSGSLLDAFLIPEFKVISDSIDDKIYRKSILHSVLKDIKVNANFNLILNNKLLPKIKTVGIVDESIYSIGDNMNEPNFNDFYDSYLQVRDKYTPQEFLQKSDFSKSDIIKTKELNYKFYDCLISIIIPFIEKHFNTTINLIKSIPKCISEKCQIIVINNSGSYKDIETFKNAGVPTDNLLVLNNDGKNLLPFNSRRLGTENAKGKWIWYIDADDEISKLSNETISTLFRDNSDVIRFSEKLIKDGKDYHTYYEVSNISDKIKNKKLDIPSVNYCLHPLFINRDFYMSQVYPMIKDIDVDFFYGEDTLLLRCILLRYKTIKDVEELIYSYSFDRGESQAILQTKECVERQIKEFPKVVKVYNSVFTKDELKQLEMDSNSYKNKVLYNITVAMLRNSDATQEDSDNLKKEFIRTILLNRMNDALNDTPRIYNL